MRKNNGKPDAQATLDIQVDDRLPTNTEEADDFYDETPAEEVETTEEAVVARASAALTIAELEAEIQTLHRLEALAQQVRYSGTDRKWGGTLKPFARGKQCRCC